MRQVEVKLSKRPVSTDLQAAISNRQSGFCDNRNDTKALLHTGDLENSSKSVKFSTWEPFWTRTSGGQVKVGKWKTYFKKNKQKCLNIGRHLFNDVITRLAAGQAVRGVSLHKRWKWMAAIFVPTGAKCRPSARPLTTQLSAESKESQKTLASRFIGHWDPIQPLFHSESSVFRHTFTLNCQMIGESAQSGNAALWNFVYFEFLNERNSLIFSWMRQNVDNFNSLFLF